MESVSKTGKEMLHVRGGIFQMGSTDGDSDEQPIRQVTVHSFYLGIYPVTQALYQPFCGKSPGFHKGTALPAEQISWYDAIEFCNRLSLAEGYMPVYTIGKYRIQEKKDPANHSFYDDLKWVVKLNPGANGYRLPTEAEWEYAAKGAKTDGHKVYPGTDSKSELEAYAWYKDNSNGSTNDVGLKKPNVLGLYDMSGNVWEWCWDWYGDYSRLLTLNPRGASSGEYRISRGGSWYEKAESCRVSFRGTGYPSYRFSNTGMRLARNG
jgi:formylglycine-generating enzyme